MDIWCSAMARCSFVNEQKVLRSVVPEPHATALSKANVDQVVMAVRPQGLTPGQAPSMLTLQVEVAESLGESTDLIGVTSAGQPMIARVDARLATQAAQMPLAIDPDKLFFFEPGPFWGPTCLKRTSRCRQ